MSRKRWFLGMAGAGAAIVAAIVFVNSTRRPGRNPAANSSRPPMDREIEDEPAAVALTSTSAAISEGPSWARFRGDNGMGISSDPNIPTAWSDTQNRSWKTKLPGPGSSSPVLTAEFAFLTTYSGYGEPTGARGNIGELKRHLLCIDREDGSIVWTKTFVAVQPEVPYQGMGVPEHGYATNSPVTDGETVFAFLGKSGVLAFDLQGNELWRVSVGTQSGNRGWGSAASLILYGDFVIVNAAEESQSIIAINKTSGEVIWRTPASTLELCYSTPAISRVDDQRDDLVLAVPGEIWGLNPKTGKLVWYVETSMTDNLSPSVIVSDDRIYAFGGYRSSGSVAIRAGGRGDVTDSHVLWTSRNSSYVATPVLVEDRLYWIDDRGLYFCVDATTGDIISKSRTPGLASGERPVYASPIAIGGNIFLQTRASGVLVLAPKSELTVLAQNKFAGDDSVFNATPAVDNGQLFLRSYDALYCVAQP